MTGCDDIDDGILRRSAVRTRRQVDWVLGFASGPGTRILDVGCGDGAHLELLEAAGCGALSGVDADPAQIDAARARGTRARLHLGDLRCVAGPYDIACAFFGGFGSGPSRDVAGDLLHLASVVVAGGWLLLDLVNHDFFPLTGPLERWCHDGQTAVLERATLDPRSSELVTTRRYTGLRGEKDFHWVQRAFTPAGIGDALRLAGFAPVGMAANEAGAPAGPRRQRLLAWSRRCP